MGFAEDAVWCLVQKEMLSSCLSCSATLRLLLALLSRHRRTFNDRPTVGSPLASLFAGNVSPHACLLCKVPLGNSLRGNGINVNGNDVNVNGVNFSGVSGFPGVNVVNVNFFAVNSAAQPSVAPPSGDSAIPCVSILLPAAVKISLSFFNSFSPKFILPAPPNSNRVLSLLTFRSRSSSRCAFRLRFCRAPCSVNLSISTAPAALSASWPPAFPHPNC